MEYTDTYDEIHVVSDLHLGGDGPFEIFGAARELAWLIGRIRTKPKSRRVALVINGDFVDFLAEEGARHFNPHKAVQILMRIARDPDYRPVWDALRDFLAAENRTLVIVLGNHDIELALPWVQAWLAGELSGGNPLHRGRLRFAMNKGGYLCRVGRSRVLCVHGNEDDPFNFVDHKKLADITADIVQGRIPGDWIPNAGSRMVIEVMNAFKVQHPFINLFKPEFGGAVTALTFVDSGALKRAPRVLSILSGMLVDATRMKLGFLGSESADREGDWMDREGLLSDVERTYGDPAARREALLATGADGDFLGVIAALRKKIMGKSEGAVLAEALEGLVEDRSFDPAHEDKTFQDLDARIAPDIPFIVAGHTHHRRALRRKRGRGFYFNSGTWAHLMQVGPKTVSDEQAMGALSGLLRDGTLKDLDKAGYLLRERTVVQIAADAQCTTGKLMEVCKGGKSPFQLRELATFTDEEVNL